MKFLLLMLLCAYCLDISAAFPNEKTLPPSPTKTPQSIDQNKEAQRHQYQCAIVQLESMINSGDLKLEFIFAALRGVAQNCGCIVDLEIGAVQEQRSYLDKAIEAYLQIMQLCKSDKDLNSIIAAESLLELENKKRNFDLKYSTSK